MGLLLSHFRGIGPHLTLRGEYCGFSRVVVGRLGFLLSYDGDIRNLSCCLRKPSVLSSCKGDHRIALKALQGNGASPHIEGGTSWCFLSCSRRFGFLLSCVGDLREAFVLSLGNQASFQDVGAPQDYSLVIAGE